MTEPVAVVGMAAVFPGAGNVADLWSNIVAGRDAIGDVPAGRIDPLYFASGELGVARGGFVDDHAQFDAARFGVMPVAVADAEPDQLLALRTAAAAVDDAGGRGALGDPEKAAVVLGRGGYLTPGVVRLENRTRVAAQVQSVLAQLAPDLGADVVAEIGQAVREAVGPAHPEATIGLVPNLAASRISNRLDLGGPAYTVDAACASSLVAIDHAVAQLASGACDSVLAGGVHHCHDITFWSVFSQLGALSSTGQIRPFSRHADGLLIGEGTGVVVLRRLSDALADGQRIYAVVHGTGVASDGRDSSLLRPRVDGQVLALRRAWASSGLDPADVGLVEAHGTATNAGDTAEAATLLSVFGREGKPLSIGSIKSMIGHCMPAAGIAGFIKASMALNQQVIPPTLHADEPLEAFDGTRLELPAAAQEWSADRGRLAAVNAFGFGGINAHVILGPAPAATPASPPPISASGKSAAFAAVAPISADRVGQPSSAGGVPIPATALDGSTVVVMAGPDSATLAEWLADATPGQSMVRVEPGPARLVILNPDERRLKLAARSLAAGTPWRGRSDVWHVPEGLVDAGGRVVWMFPGVEPTFDPQLDGIAEALGISEPTELSADGTGLGFQGAGIVHLGRFLDTAVRSLGAAPDAICGHSVGEWAAMIASGLIPPDELERLLDEIDPATLEVPGVQFVALGCGAERAAGLIDGLGDVTVTHDNCPHQSIACGPDHEIAQVVERAKAERVMAQVLPFRSGFHSPAFEPYLGQVRRHLDTLRTVTPHTPLWSATTVAPYPSEPEAIRALGIEHLLSPVRFRQLIAAFYNEGARVFVQLGVGSLAAFVDDTLSDATHVAISVATERGSGVSQLARLAAALWAEGAAIDGAAIGIPAESAVSAASQLATGTDPVSAPDRTIDAVAAPEPAKGALLQLGAPLLRLPEELVNRVRSMLASAASTALTGTPAGISGSAFGGTPAGMSGGARPTVSASQSVVGSALGASADPIELELAALFAETAATSDEVARFAAAAPAGARRAHRRTHSDLAGRSGSDFEAPQTGGAPSTGQRVSNAAGLASPVGSTDADGWVGPGSTGTGLGPQNFDGVADRGSPQGDGGSTPLNGAAQPDGGIEATQAAENRSGRRSGPADSTTTTLDVSLAAMPWLADHCFYRQPADNDDPGLAFPVVPMTAMCELMMDAAASTNPGTVAVELRDVRALRWLPAEPANQVGLTVGPAVAQPDGTHTVKVSLDGYTRGTVVLAADYPAAPPTRTLPFGPTRPHPIDGADLYPHRWMFHGPRYQGVSGISDWFDQGVIGTIDPLDSPGAVLDCAGQLMGLWAMHSLDINVLAFPQSIKSMRFFGPRPQRPVRCEVAITGLADRSVTATMDLNDGDTTWCQIDGWEDRRFDTDEVLWPFLRFPETRTVAQRQPEGWWLVDERWGDSASRELLARRYAASAERADYDRRNPLGQRAWLLGRAAAKDAVRQHLWATGSGPLFPVEVQIGNDEHGAPFITAPPEATGLSLSIAHTTDRAVAHLGTGPESVGIDIERIEPRTDRFIEMSLTLAERSLLRGRPADEADVVLTAIWACKEATAKAARTGLEGRPKDWEVTQLTDDSAQVATPDGSTVRLTLTRIGDHVVAATTSPGPALAAEPHPATRLPGEPRHV